MAIDDTFHESPITPGPVFAYRAFRGFLFGSPETPMPVSTFHPVAQDDKENVAMADAPSKLSPTRARPIFDLSTKLTPSSKRKRSSGMGTVLSPTKSCLRTPGAITPRRAMLKDMNVTFKDRIISPELMKDNQREVIRIHEDHKPSLAAPETRKKGVIPVKAPQIASSSSSKTQEPITSAQPIPHTTQHAPPAITSNFDIQAYIQNSEKEMKKLIRYSQKMREYARKQDEENSKLKKLIDDLKRENERLRGSESVDRPTTATVPDQSGAARETRRSTSNVLPRPSSPSKRGIAIVERTNAESDTHQQHKRIRPSRLPETQPTTSNKRDVGTERGLFNLPDIHQIPHPLRSTATASTTQSDNDRPSPRLNSQAIQTRLQHTPASTRHTRTQQFNFGSNDTDNNETNKLEFNVPIRTLSSVANGGTLGVGTSNTHAMTTLNDVNGATVMNGVSVNGINGANLPPDRRARARARLHEKSQLRRGTILPITANAEPVDMDVDVNMNMDIDIEMNTARDTSMHVELECPTNTTHKTSNTFNTLSYAARKIGATTPRTRFTHPQKANGNGKDKGRQVDRVSSIKAGAGAGFGAGGVGVGSSSILSDWAGL